MKSLAVYINQNNLCNMNIIIYLRPGFFSSLLHIKPLPVNPVPQTLHPGFSQSQTLIPYPNPYLNLMDETFPYIQP